MFHSQNVKKVYFQHGNIKFYIFTSKKVEFFMKYDEILKTVLIIYKKKSDNVKIVIDEKVFF